MLLKEDINFPMDIRSNLNIAKAWESFTESGEIQTHTDVRKVIQQSWFKSRSLGIRPDVDRAQTVITADEIEEKVKGEDLGRVGISVLDELANTLKDTQHVIVLADPKGRIFYSVGHRQVQDKLERINFRPGGAWSEDLAGSNGVGTPIALGRPEIVMGYEHYCQGWHPWVCYGAPIYDQSGQQILGSVDITGPVKSLNLEVLALAISVANSIKSGLSIMQYHRRELLRDIAKQKLQQWHSDGAIVLDENGFIVEFNAKAAKYLNLESSELLNKSIAKYIPALSESIQRCYRTKKVVEINYHMQAKSGLMVPVRLHIEPMFKGDKCLGTTLVMVNTAQNSAITNDAKPRTLRPQSRFTFNNLKGNSQGIKNTIRLAKAAANDPLESNVLLYGETGTGKELLAHSIHSESKRCNGPFITVNCAAIPRELIESELFGYVAGAFTGANRNGQKGKFESAHNGTIFLDEINSLSMDLQAKFLRVLDSMEINRVGSTEPIQVNVRVIAAANELVNDAVEQGSFRSDLFHRLSVLEISIPKLMDRGDDIIELANEFLQKECLASGRGCISLSPEVKTIMKNYHWPGNIRELNNICTRWVLTVAGNTVTNDDIPEKLKINANKSSSTEVIFNSGMANDMRSINDELIKQTLIKTDNNISKAARILGIDRTTIYRRRRNW